MIFRWQKEEDRKSAEGKQCKGVCKRVHVVCKKERVGRCVHVEVNMMSFLSVCLSSMLCRLQPSVCPFHVSRASMCR